MIGQRWFIGPLLAATWLLTAAPSASAKPYDETESRNLGTVRAGFDAEGTARDGVPYRDTYSWFLTLADNQIVKGTAFFDSIAFNDFWQRVPAQS